MRWFLELSQPWLVLGHAVDFLKAGNPLHGLEQSGGAQVIKAVFTHLRGNIDGVAFLHDNPLQVGRVFNHFINTDTALVTTVAVFAAYRAVNFEGAELVFGETFGQQRLARYVHFLLAKNFLLPRLHKQTIESPKINHSIPDHPVGPSTSTPQKWLLPHRVQYHIKYTAV